MTQSHDLIICVNYPYVDDSFICVNDPYVDDSFTCVNYPWLIHMCELSMTLSHGPFIRVNDPYVWIAAKHNERNELIRMDEWRTHTYEWVTNSYIWMSHELIHMNESRTLTYEWVTYTAVKRHERNEIFTFIVLRKSVATHNDLK